jgi:hypothetical protein
MNWNKQVQAAWQREIEQGSYDVVGVLKFNRGTAISSSTAETLHSAYWHKLDRMLFGRAADKGVCVERWCFVEGGEFGNNKHLHFVARAPFDTKLFCAVAAATWTNLHRYTSSYNYSWITPVQHQEGVSSYNSKETWWLRDDMAGVRCSRRTAPGTDYYTFENPAQAQRILSRIGEEELIKADEAVRRNSIKVSQSRQLRRARQLRQRLVELRGIQQA